MLMMTGGYPPQTVLRNLGFHPLDGFSFVTTVCGYPMVYAVAPDSPIQSFPDLLARAKADPGKLTYTITALGSIYHMLTAWIELEAGVRMTPIPYRGSAQALQDVLGGRVDVMVDAATSMFPRIKSGQLRLLAVSSAGRFPLMPDALRSMKACRGSRSCRGSGSRWRPARRPLSSSASTARSGAHWPCPMCRHGLSKAAILRSRRRRRNTASASSGRSPAGGV
jgi:hypothetical protein